MSNIFMEAQAETILDAAKAVAAKNSEATFGPKVFISAVLDEMDNRVSMEKFREVLVELNQLRLITLSRADMAFALNQTYVRASEFEHMTSTFHFIRID